MNLQESGEMYLETIYILSLKNKTVRSLDVAEYLGYSKPSITRAMKVLKSAGYVISDEDGHLKLTDSGKVIACKTYEKHVLLTDFFKSIGVKGDIAEQDACRVEHYLSDETVAAIKTHVNGLVTSKKK